MTPIMLPMRVTKHLVEVHREAILAAAGRLFRARGVAGVPVAEVMQAAGLTHGGFYGHYPSKAALAASACRKALADGAARWRRTAARARDDGRDPIAAIATSYLSEAHLGRPEDGCAIPALGADAWRAGPPLSTALAEGLRELVQILQQEAPTTTPDPHASALAALSAMVGGMVVARASLDPAAAREVLEASRSLALRAFQPQN